MATARSAVAGVIGFVAFALVICLYNLNRPLPPASPKTHIFYYAWYGLPERDGAYYHWAHRVLIENGTVYQPPAAIGANFYPADGLYSSSDRSTIARHMKDIREAGAGVVCLSWYPPGTSDGNLASPGYVNAIMPDILDAARGAGLTVSIHVEPYVGRTGASVAADIAYLLDRFGSHAAFHRDPQTRRPVLFVYDAYKTPVDSWAEVLRPDGARTIRGTDHDAIVLGLLLSVEDNGQDIVDAGFDGVYTYFAAHGFTPASEPANWVSVAAWAHEHGLLWVPSVGPGYDDRAIRPWNAVNYHDREAGDYFVRGLRSAVASGPDLLSITSYNEWHEGTQIEAARVGGQPAFEDYGTEMDTRAYIRLCAETLSHAGWWPVAW